MENLSLQAGTLWSFILRQTEHALRSGSLHPIETTETMIDEGGVRFQVRQVSSLTRKDQIRKKREVEVDVNAVKGSVFNPFLPYEADLFVADISDTHIALLNKFPVIDHHLLIVTRCFKMQEALLDLADFAALTACMAEFDGIGFYNGGAQAGASQPHKHLQIVPLPLGASGPALPIESVLESARMEDPVGTVPGLTFRHAFARLELGASGGAGIAASVTAPQAAQTAFDCYHALLVALGLKAIEVNGALCQSAPYNLLVTRRWMLLVPRSAEFVEGISVNALGFAGSFFVRDAARMEVIRRLGPMTVLQRAAALPGMGPQGLSVI